MFSSARQRARTSGPGSAATPSAVSTSELPELPVAARLPCLTTGTPQAAATIAAAVEMFTVPAPSPPVPHVSSSRSGAIRSSHRDHPPADRPNGPFQLVGRLARIRMAVRNAAATASETSPSSNEPTARSTSSADSVPPVESARRHAVAGSITATGSCAARSCLDRAVEVDVIAGRDRPAGSGSPRPVRPTGWPGCRWTRSRRGAGPLGQGALGVHVQDQGATPALGQLHPLRRARGVSVASSRPMAKLDAEPGRFGRRTRPDRVLLDLGGAPANWVNVCSRFATVTRNVCSRGGRARRPPRPTARSAPSRPC